MTHDQVHAEPVVVVVGLAARVGYSPSRNGPVSTPTSSAVRAGAPTSVAARPPGRRPPRGGRPSPCRTGHNLAALPGGGAVATLPGEGRNVLVDPRGRRTVVRLGGYPHDVKVASETLVVANTAAARLDLVGTDGGRPGGSRCGDARTTWPSRPTAARGCRWREATRWWTSAPGRLAATCPPGGAPTTCCLVPTAVGVSLTRVALSSMASCWFWPMPPFPCRVTSRSSTLAGRAGSRGCCRSSLPSAWSCTSRRPTCGGTRGH